MFNYALKKAGIRADDVWNGEGEFEQVFIDVNVVKVTIAILGVMALLTSTCFFLFILKFKIGAKWGLGGCLKYMWLFCPSAGHCCSACLLCNLDLDADD